MKDACHITVSWTPNTQSSFFIQPTIMLPGYENALPRAQSIPEKTEHQLINLLEYTGRESEYERPEEMHSREHRFNQFCPSRKGE